MSTHLVGDLCIVLCHEQKYAHRLIPFQEMTEVLSYCCMLCAMICLFFLSHFVPVKIVFLRNSLIV
jgi:hypothetical protein